MGILHEIWSVDLLNVGYCRLRLNITDSLLAMGSVSCVLSVVWYGRILMSCCDFYLKRLNFHSITDKYGAHLELEDMEPLGK